MKITLWYSVLFIYVGKRNILRHFPLYILALLKLLIIFHTKDHLVLSIIQISFVSPWTKLLFKAKGSKRPIYTALQSNEIWYWQPYTQIEFISICLQYYMVFYNSIGMNNSDPRHGQEFGCNSEAWLYRGARLLVDFNAFRNFIQFLVM